VWGETGREKKVQEGEKKGKIAVPKRWASSEKKTGTGKTFRVSMRTKKRRPGENTGSKVLPADPTSPKDQWGEKGEKRGKPERFQNRVKKGGT